MCGEEHCRPFGQLDEGVAYGIGEEVEVGGFEVPCIDRMQGESVFRTGLRGASLVLADTEPRIVRGEHESDRIVEVHICECGDAVLDER